jgi:FtsP/CotA-like multicopper oxidase with cupredoxin domain
MFRVCFLFLALAACTRTPAQRLLGEFEGAYPAAARPNGTVRTFEITAAEGDVVVAGEKLHTWAYNGQVPGPELHVRLGETVRVKFTNHLSQSTTIHWHGVRVPNDMDGVPTPERPPIEPGQSFTYEFTPKDAGTFWYHPHIRSSEQVERGLYGVLIVDDAKPQPWSREVTWVLDDWLLTPERTIFPEFNTLHDLMHDGRWGNVLTVSSQKTPLLVARPGERIRLRLLNSANGRVFVPDFGGLSPRIIAVDGLYVREPLPLVDFELSPGNRVDLDLVMPNLTGTFAVSDRFLAQRPNPLAEIRVDGEPVATPSFDPPAGRVPPWREGTAVPITKQLDLDARRGGSFGIEWTINGHAYPDHDHIALPLAQFSRVRFVNKSARLHPIHTHGMFFRLLARNDQRVDEGFFRDTVLIHPREAIDVGVVPLDAGSWMMHCHILEHAEAGMMSMIEVH